MIYNHWKGAYSVQCSISHRCLFPLLCSLTCVFKFEFQLHSNHRVHCSLFRSPTDFVRLDQDILSPLAGKKQLYTYETMDFWEQIKTPG